MILIRVVNATNQTNQIDETDQMNQKDQIDQKTEKTKRREKESYNLMDVPRAPDLCGGRWATNVPTATRVLSQIVSCFRTYAAHPGRLKDEDICYNNKIMKQMEYDER